MMLGVAAALALTACDDGKTKDLQGQIDALTRENTALKAERDALRTQSGTVRQGAVAQGSKQVLAEYLRRCQLAVESFRLEEPAAGLNALDGKSCSDPLLTVGAFPDIKDSLIMVMPGGVNEYHISATAVDGQVGSLSE